jgi:hypothetical protein
VGWGQVGLLNSIVRPMTKTAHRSIELLVGLGMVGYRAYSMYQGHIFGRFRSYTRSEEPWSFWTTVLIVFCIGLIFLSGHVSWRD